MKSLVTVLQEIENVRVIDAEIKYDAYIPIDLSITNEELSKLKIEKSSDFEIYIDNYLDKNDAKVAFGGYNEVRNLYKRSKIFSSSNSEERNIHIGLDLWIKSGTPVLAALDGFVHCFNYNMGVGDYGPTIILEHHIEKQIFYTLYGHLSLESINNLKVGTFYKKGQQLGTLGDSSVNGDYAPHLHFQIIKKLVNKFGDYPGVCSKKDLKHYLDNCPDPNILLKIK